MSAILSTNQVIPEDFPGLREVAWNRDPKQPITPSEALALYERNWRYLDPSSFNDDEKELVQQLVRCCGNGVLLV